MKPRGLTNEHKPQEKAYAVVQLRQDNALGTLYNMVGFQTKLKYGEQLRIFRTIPGLEKAEFARLGGLHRNTFLNSPRLLDGRLRLKACPRLRFAGQMTGVEGYVESAAIGLLAGRMAAAEMNGAFYTAPPPTTAHGALINHITGGHIELTDGLAGSGSFQPMNVNFGLFPPSRSPRAPTASARAARPSRRRARLAYTSRAKADFTAWLAAPAAAAESRRMAAYSPRGVAAAVKPRIASTGPCPASPA
jgi:methylenetetrahydrofolate--tRNA-(uracil-5-)-methyltransferase